MYNIHTYNVQKFSIVMYRSESKSQTHSNEQLGVASGGVARGRQDREGSFATEEYLALNNAPPADIGSRSGSVSSCELLI